MKKSIAIVVMSGFLFAACGGEAETNNDEGSAGEEQNPQTVTNGLKIEGTKTSS